MAKSFFVGILGVMFLSGYTLGMQRFGVQGLQAILPKVSVIAASPAIIQAVNKFSATSKLYKDWNHNQKPEEVLGLKCKQPDIKEVYWSVINTIKNCDPKDTDKVFMTQEALKFFEEKHFNNLFNETENNQEKFKKMDQQNEAVPKKVEQIIQNGSVVNIHLMGRDRYGLIFDRQTLIQLEKDYLELVNELNLDQNNLEEAKKQFLEKYPNFDSKILGNYFFQQQSLRNYKKDFKRESNFQCNLVCGGLVFLGVNLLFAKKKTVSY